MVHSFPTRRSSDLTRVAVVARLADGAEAALVPYDPDQELRPVSLAGRYSGGEALAYPTARPASQVCADVASIVPPAAGAAASPGQWLCFGSPIDVTAAEAARAAAAQQEPLESADDADASDPADDADASDPADAPAPAAPSLSEVTP